MGLQRSFLVLYHLGTIHNQLVIPRKKNLKSLSVKRKAVPLQADYYQIVDKVLILSAVNRSLSGNG